jgi:tetratricopeptide (TPR) repeat protein
MTWQNRGNFHLDRKELGLAVDAFAKVLEEAEEKKDFRLIAESLKDLGRTFLEKGQWVLAAKILNGALALFQNATTSDPKAQQIVLSYMAEVERRFLEKECQVKASPKPEIYLSRRKQLQTLRNSVQTQLERHYSLQNDLLEFSRNVLSDFSSAIGNFLQEILKSGHLILGKPPCEYTLIGLGSLGRREMSPYSDLEFALLVKKNSPENLEYFRKLVKWLEIQVIHLGETEIKILEHGFTSPVRRGFSFDDGGNTPLGKQSYVELIKTPEEMAQFQTERFYSEDLILSNVLRTAGVLTGEESLFKSYLKSMRGILSTKPAHAPFTLAQLRALNIIQGHLVEFEPEVGSKKEETPLFDIKLELYRLHSFLIAGLAEYFGIEEQNTWDKLDALAKKKILSPPGAQNLREALAKIMRLRIQCHLHYGRECDEAYHPAMQKKDLPRERIRQAFILSDAMIEEMIKIFRVMLPLHRLFKEVSRTHDFTPLAQNPIYDDSLLVQGEAYEKLNQFQQAKRCYQQAMALNPDDVEVQLKLAYLLINLAEYDEAKKYTEKVLSAAQGREDILSRAVGLQGTILVELGDPKGAIEQFTQALEMEKRRNGNEHPTVASYLNNLGIAWKTLGNAKKAIGYYEEALKIGKKFYGDEHPKVATDLNNLGSAWQALGDAKKAIGYYEEALKIDKNVYGDEHPEVAKVLNNLGSAWEALGDAKKALGYYEEALKIDKNVYGNEHPTVATDLNNLGGAWRALGDAKKAIGYLEEALKIGKKVCGDEHSNVASCLNNLGVAWKDLGDAKKAIEYLEEALKIGKKVYGDEHPKVAIYLNNLGVVWKDLGDAEKALVYFEQALKILKQVYGDNHPHTRSVLEWIVALK